MTSSEPQQTGGSKNRLKCKGLGTIIGILIGISGLILTALQLVNPERLCDISKQMLGEILCPFPTSTPTPTRRPTPTQSEIHGTIIRNEDSVAVCTDPPVNPADLTIVFEAQVTSSYHLDAPNVRSSNCWCLTPVGSENVIEDCNWSNTDDDEQEGDINWQDSSVQILLRDEVIGECAPPPDTHVSHWCEF